MVATVFAAREMAITDVAAQVTVEKMRKHFGAARAIHQIVKGPSSYPAKPGTFFAANDPRRAGGRAHQVADF